MRNFEQYGKLHAIGEDLNRLATHAMAYQQPFDPSAEVLAKIHEALELVRDAQRLMEEEGRKALG